MKLRNSAISSKFLRGLGAALLGSWIAAVSASAALWEWTDGAGRVHKARSIGDIPEEFRGSATEVAEPKPAAPQPAAGPSADTEPRSDGGPGSASDTTPNSFTTAKGPVDKDGHDKEWWQDQVKAARGNLIAAERKVDQVQTRLAHETLERNRIAERKELAAARTAAEAAQKEIEVELPKKARAAGAPSWWVK